MWKRLRNTMQSLQNDEKVLIREKKYYDSIDGLRAYSALGIVLMHVLSNGDYALQGFIFERLIPSFTNLVFLFMVVSGFSMCCGYYEGIIANKISIEAFYKKRYAKIWPYFALLCLFDLLISPSINSLFEVFANMTLCFGLLPNPEISVIGVGWFLGVVFVFYLIFPFFCFLLADSKRAWLSFIVAIIFNFLCTIRYNAGRTNIVYSAVFFFAGGLIFLYKEKLAKLVKRYKIVFIIGIILMSIMYLGKSMSVSVMLGLFALMLIYTLDVSCKHRILSNSITKYISGISMEIYLSHMLIYRVIEKFGMLHLFKSDECSYFVTIFMTLVGTIIFSIIVKKGLMSIRRWINTICNKEIKE